MLKCRKLLALEEGAASCKGQGLVASLGCRPALSSERGCSRPPDSPGLSPRAPGGAVSASRSSHGQGNPATRSGVPCPLPPQPATSTQGLRAELLPSVLVRVSPLPAVPHQLPDGGPTPDCAPCPGDPASPSLVHGARRKGTQHFPVELTHCCEMHVFQWSPTLCDPTDSSPPGSSVRGTSQLRILGWAAMSSCRGWPRPRDLTRISLCRLPCRGFFTTRAAWD